MTEVEVLAQHGWGFSAECWRDWRDLLPANFALHCPDRGYFGPPCCETSSRFQIVITHSLGLHMVASECLQAAKLVVVLGGFAHFHADRANLARRSRRTVDRMLARLQREPAALLGDFYARCGIGGNSRLPGDLDVARLRADLQCLQDSVLGIEGLSAAGHVLILHGDEDRIVPVERAEELHEALDNSDRSIFPSAGHGLPISHARECWQAIERAWRLQCAQR